MFKPFFRPKTDSRIMRKKIIAVWNFLTAKSSCYISIDKNAVKYIFKELQSLITWRNAYWLISIVTFVLACMKVAGIVVEVFGFFCPQSFSAAQRILLIVGTTTSKLWAMTGAKWYAPAQAIEKLLKATSTSKAKDK